MLAISDVGDRLFDSGVFLEKGSMVSGEYSTFVSSSPNGLSDTVTTCHAGKLMFKRCPNINEKWTIYFIQEGNAIPNVDYKRRLPNGLLVNFPDSMVLESGLIADSIMIEGVGTQYQTKSVVFKYLDLQTPYINGQPNFTGNKTSIQVRPFANKAVSEISGCWFDSAKVTFKGPNVSHIKYRWLGLVNEAEDSITELPISCRNCQTPKIAVDTNNKSYVVKIENEQNGCFRFDTVLVTGKSFVLPQFEIIGDTLKLHNTRSGYQYSWLVNGILALSGSYQITFNPEDQISLEVNSPNGCFKTIWKESISSSVSENKFPSFQISLFPNPAEENIKLEVKEEGNHFYKITSFNGQLILSGFFSESKILSLTKLKPGLYSVAVINDRGESKFSRFSKI